jgi:adenylate kinase
MNIIIFGPNGSGKGTQSSLIRNELGVAHIESGDIFRDHISNGTELGRQAKVYMDKGELVPDEITIPMVLDTLKDNREKGWLLDGFPRNVIQAEKLWDAIQSEGLTLDFIVEIKLDRDEARRRIVGRRICIKSSHHPNNVNIEAISPLDGKCRICQGELKTRPDDQDEVAISKRHDIYYDKNAGTLASIDFFKNLPTDKKPEFVILEGHDSIENIRVDLLSKLKK